MTLRARLTATFVLVVLVPLLVVAVLLVTALPKVLADRQGPGVVSSARLAATLVAQLCDQAQLTAETAGRSSDLPGLSAVLDTLIAGGQVDGVRVVDAAGETLGVSGTAPPAPAAPEPQDRGACTTGRTGDVVQVMALVQLTRASGAAGWAVAAVDVDDALADRLQDYAGVGQVVLLADGEPIAASGPVADDLLRLAVGAGTETPVRDGTDVAALVPGTPLDVLVTQPEGAGEGLNVIWLAAAVALGALLLAMALGRLFARATTQPLQELGDAAARVADGDLSTSIEVRSRDEIGRLATAFNTMTDALRSYVGALQASQDELRAGVARLGDTLSGTHDLDLILGVVLDAAMATTRAQAGAVLILDEGRTGLAVAVGQRLEDRGVPDDLRLPVGVGVAGRVAATGEPVLGRVGTGPDELHTAPGEPTATTLVAVPLTSSSGVIGVLVLLDRDGGEDFDAGDLATLRTFTSQATVAVDNVLLHEEARRLSITDGLTGLWNYRYFQMTVEKEVERAARFGRPLAVLMLDLDHFKAVNDSHGHQRGDEVLAELATRVRSQVRDVDTLARYGGEEFIAVLPETDGQGASLVAERIREAVAAQPFGATGALPITLTVSIGVAVFPSHGDDAAGLVRSADAALYEAKRSGRNAWRLAAGELADEGAPVTTS